MPMIRPEARPLLRRREVRARLDALLTAVGGARGSRSRRAFRDARTIGRTGDNHRPAEASACESSVAKAATEGHRDRRISDTDGFHRKEMGHHGWTLADLTSRPTSVHQHQTIRHPRMSFGDDGEDR